LVSLACAAQLLDLGLLPTWSSNFGVPVTVMAALKVAVISTLSPLL